MIHSLVLNQFVDFDKKKYNKNIKTEETNELKALNSNALEHYFIIDVIFILCFAVLRCAVL